VFAAAAELAAELFSLDIKSVDFALYLSNMSLIPAILFARFLGDMPLLFLIVTVYCGQDIKG